MGVYSGKYGIVDGISTTRQWGITESESQPKGVTSNSQLGTIRRPGVRSWQGSYQGYGAVPAKMPGELFTFQGFIAPASGVAGTTGQAYQGQAMVNSVTINWDWRSAQIISHTVNFMGHLALVQAPVIPVIDATEINDPSTIGTKITWDTASPTAIQELGCLATSQLTISSQIQSFVNSCTVVNGVAWTGRVSGPLDWNLSVVQDSESRLLAEDLKMADIVQLKLYTTLTQYWELQFGIVREYGNITVNRETGAIVSRTINVDMMAHNAAVIGRINRPDGSTWWPASPVG